MTARADQSCGKVLKKEWDRISHCTATYSLWNMKVVSLVLSNSRDASLNLLHQFYGLLTPWICCLWGEQKEEVGLLKFLFLRGLMLSATGLAAAPCSVAVKLKIRLSKGVRNYDVPLWRNCDGSKVAPSGQLPSRLTRPTVSMTASLYNSSASGCVAVAVLLETTWFYNNNNNNNNNNNYYYYYYY